MGFDAICIQLVIPVLLGDRQLGISAHCDLRSVAMVEHQVQLPAEVKGTNIMQSPESVNTIYMVHEGCRNSLEALATGFTDAPRLQRSARIFYFTCRQEKQKSTWATLTFTGNTIRYDSCHEWRHTVRYNHFLPQFILVCPVLSDYL